jgi:hypothetical protein
MYDRNSGSHGDPPFAGGDALGSLGSTIVGPRAPSSNEGSYEYATWSTSFSSMPAAPRQ